MYLNLQSDQHGKDHYAAFVRKELAGRARTFPAPSEARDSFDRDVERIERYLAEEVSPTANGLALFACAGLDDFFEAMALDAPIPGHRLSVAGEPHLYPLELVLDQHPRHAVVLADSHAARLFVFGRGQINRTETVVGEKVNHSSVGDWSQMRYQRHTEKLQADHARELVKSLERLVRDEGIKHIVLAGDEVNVPLVKNELSKELAAMVIETVKLDVRTPEQDVMKAAAEALRRHDSKTDAEVVERVLGDYLAGGLGVAGLEETQIAIDNGQVYELLLTAVPAADAGEPDGSADTLVSKARQTSARIRFIEDPALLAAVGGVAAALRYRVDGPPAPRAEERA